MRLATMIASLLCRRLPGVVVSERGQTMLEYGILLVWIVLVIFAALTTIGHNLSQLLNSTATRV